MTLAPELIGFVDLTKNPNSESDNTFNNPVFLDRTINYNFILKDYDTSKYQFRLLVNYTYIIPSTIQSTDPTNQNQDVVVSLEIFGKNRLTQEDIGYFYVKNMNYNLSPEILSDRVALTKLILNGNYRNIVSKQGIFKNIILLETKGQVDVFPPKGWGFYFYKDNSQTNPPDISGRWKTKEFIVTYGENTIDNPTTIEYQAELQQNGRFVYSKSDGIEYYGVFEYIENDDQKWRLSMVQKDTRDIFKFNLNIIKDKVVQKMDYMNYESGVKPQVAYATWTRLS